MSFVRAINFRVYEARKFVLDGVMHEYQDMFISNTLSLGVIIKHEVLARCSARPHDLDLAFGRPHAAGSRGVAASGCSQGVDRCTQGFV